MCSEIIVNNRNLLNGWRWNNVSNIECEYLQTSYRRCNSLNCDRKLKILSHSIFYSTLSFFRGIIILISFENYFDFRLMRNKNEARKAIDISAVMYWYVLTAQPNDVPACSKFSRKYRCCWRSTSRSRNFDPRNAAALPSNWERSETSSRRNKATPGDSVSEATKIQHG